MKDNCKGCNEPVGDYPALSRYDHGDICSTCGIREAFGGDFITRYAGTPTTPAEILEIMSPRVALLVGMKD